jgi:hypothetical protein
MLAFRHTDKSAATNIHAIIMHTLIVLNKPNFVKEIVETPANQAIAIT